ncbi:MAG: helix-turn-helix domain-containing protein [Gammaproteobacteria bacterium]
MATVRKPARKKTAIRKAPAGRRVARKPAVLQPRWQRDRAGKERDLIRAFDRLLQEQGAHRIGVNAIVKEAGVGKNLLYSYFGGLEGLAAAWAREADFLPGDPEIMGTDEAAYARLTTAEQLTSNYRNFSAALRRRPHTLEILAGELLQQTEVTQALDQVREHYGKGLRRFFTRPDEYDRQNATALQLILYAAVIYLAQRSRTSPRYFGLHLDQPEGWRQIDDAIGLIVKGVMRSDAGAPGRRRKKRPTG